MPLARTFCALWLLAGLADASYPMPPHRLADRDFLSKQTKIVELLLHVGQPLPDSNLTASFSLLENADKFQETAQVERFAALHARGYFLGRGLPFSILRGRHREQAEATVHLLLAARDFQTFYSAAAWARQHLNEELFSYAFTVAVLHRGDTEGVVLPAPYELWPRYFLSSNVMRRAYDARLRGGEADKGMPHVVATSGGQPAFGCAEALLSYFREDVGLNAHWAMRHYRCPFWSSAGCDRRGELFYFRLRQLAARYDLERHSLGLEPVQPLQYPPLYQEPYDTQTMFHNDAVCASEGEIYLPDTPHVWTLKIHEERICDAIDAGSVLDRNYTEHSLRTPEAIETLGNIIEGNAGSVNLDFYGSLYRGLLKSFSHSQDSSSAKQVPSLVENPASALRDPLFYRAVKKLLEVFNRFKDRLGPYKREELEFPGVRVESVFVKTLSTQLEKFEFELDNALPAPSTQEASRRRVVARQRRLSARPFQYQLAVSSRRDAVVDAVLRVYLGPRRRPGAIDQDRHRFVLFDTFAASLSPGVTTLRRTYKDLRFHGRSPLALSALRRRAMAALSSGWRLYVDDLARPLGGVERLALPRGRSGRGGLPVSLLVVVSPAPSNITTTTTTNTTITAVAFPPNDGRAADFPLDRPLAYDSDFDLSNVRFADVTIVHRG